MALWSFFVLTFVAAPAHDVVAGAADARPLEIGLLAVAARDAGIFVVVDGTPAPGRILDAAAAAASDAGLATAVSKERAARAQRDAAEVGVRCAGIDAVCWSRLAISADLPAVLVVVLDGDSAAALFVDVTHDAAPIERVVPRGDAATNVVVQRAVRALAAPPRSGPSESTASSATSQTSPASPARAAPSSASSPSSTAAAPPSPPTSSAQRVAASPAATSPAASLNAEAAADAPVQTEVRVGEGDAPSNATASIAWPVAGAALAGAAACGVGAGVIEGVLWLRPTGYAYEHFAALHATEIALIAAAGLGGLLAAGAGAWALSEDGEP